MVNHFSSLLTNINLTVIRPSVRNYLLMGADNYVVETNDDAFIEISEIASGSVELEKIPSKFLNKDYTVMNLPFPLKGIHSLLFPDGASDYYKQFLLFNYLKVIEAADLSDHTLKYDKRVTYDLHDLSESSDYFRIPKISVPKSSDRKFTLLPSGELTLQQDLNYFFTTFIIRQIDNSPIISVFSPVQRKYYKFGMPDSYYMNDMTTVLSLSEADSNMTKQVKIGDTGLAFNIVGPMEDFVVESNKTWKFTAETSFKFDLVAFMKQLDGDSERIKEMFDYGRSQANQNYENLWSSHYNDIYKLAGLLLAYVERVNFVWLSKLI
jgi:hypothetical protein